MAVCREQWLNAAVKALRPRFTAAGHTLPERIQVSVGELPLDEGARCISHMHPRQARVGHIYVADHYGDPVHVLAALLHELCHLATDEALGKPYGDHGAPFVEVFRSVGMNWRRPLSHCCARGTRAELRKIAERLGPYPHVRIS